jgi:ketosteroid isomerase-like protein
VITGYQTEQDVASFFDGYAAAFDQRDWPAFVALLHEPVLTVRADGSVKCLQSRAEARHFFETVADSWKNEGYRRFVASNFELTPIGRTSLLATLDWTMIRGDGTVLRTWRQSYQLLQVQGNWQVLTFTYHVQ